ncbi:hypothetical protein roselon_01355 [Roseibacterium elongatum DSM 19469]|uniref:Polysaccharide pyruvyl transferase domain-containing protein n=1 Tax=Roseicyclus elongatus DSM 19469 TaxID=1294273 RepID=W8RRM4_9RHOB|nr:polysaccharide pyruvyl transferase family protein [Roseibacterium elongatum]AHM03743.1 hypothetical protein roselon_01355 [Roseibacterium elongatum DSM 19469]
MTSAYVLTHHSVPNFGANLQAYATSRALAARGIDARYVDFRPPELDAKYRAGVSQAQRAAHAAFCSQHLRLTSPVETLADFEALCRAEPADLYVSGSDAVFRLQPDSGRADLCFPNPYWLVGATGPNGAPPRRVSVAPSAMGCDLSALPAETRAGLAAALAQFDALSVRDPWTAEQIKGLGGDPTLVPDPVFSLLPQIREMRATRPEGRPYIVICSQGRRDAAWVKALTARAEGRGVETVAVPNPEGICDDGTTRRIDLPLDPLDWAALIARSEGYVGGRFHPVVVALTAGVPAVAIDIYHRTPLERKRSKTWLIMREFGCASACHSRAMHRVLTPGLVWAQLGLQRRATQKRLCMGDALAARVAHWFDHAFGPVSQPQQDAAE